MTIYYIDFLKQFRFVFCDLKFQVYFYTDFYGICQTELFALYSSDLSRPRQGVITPPPSFHATPPNHLKFKDGYQGGVYVIVMEGVKY